MKYLRTGTSLTALSLSLAALASPVLGQEEPARKVVLSFEQEFDYDLDTGLETSTGLSLALTTSTRTETFSFSLGTELAGDFSDGSDDTFNLENYFSTLRYTRKGSNSQLTFSASYREVDLGDTLFELLPDFFIFDEDGSLTSTSFGATVETGIEGPFGLRLDARYRDLDYENTADPDIVDEVQTTVEALARFSLSPSMDLRARAGISNVEEDDPFDTERDVTFYGLGVGGTTASGLTFAADVIYDESKVTTNSLPGSRKDDGIGFEIAVLQPRRNGTVGASLSSRLDDTGRRVTAEVSRELTLRNGGLGFALGVVDQEGASGLQFVGGVTYQAELPQGEMSARLRQTTGSRDGDAVVSTSLILAYRQEINAYSGWETQFEYAATDELFANEDDSETTASIAYTRDLTSEWSMQTGYEYSRDNGGDANNSLFLNIQRDITFGF